MEISTLTSHRYFDKRENITKLDVFTVQNSFADVIKAKVNFDTKFLGFEATLHKAASLPTNIAGVGQHSSNVTVRIFFSSLSVWFSFSFHLIFFIFRVRLEN